MGERLSDQLQNAADVLRWFGKYDESNALILVARLLRATSVETVDDLATFVADIEAKVP